MKERLLLFSIALTILALSFFWIPSDNLTGFAVTESPVSIELDSSKFAKDTDITGTLTLSLSENIDPTERISINFDGDEYTYTLEEILDKANYSIEYDSAEFNATNEATEKTLSFTTAGTQFLGLKIPRYAEVSDMSFSLATTGSPTAVSMDFGNEGTIDWHYLGSFLGYNTTKITSKDFDDTEEGIGFVEGEIYYCEILNLPRTKHLTIEAEYTKLGSEGDLQAVALSVPTGNPGIGWSGGSDTCDLPESGPTNSCAIEFDYTIEGEYLVCLFNQGSYTEGASLYEIPLDNSQETDTAYTCPLAENSVCEETSFNNFFISAQAGKYNNTLTGDISIEDWETFTGSILTGIKYYVGSEPYNGVCKTTSCSIPINVTSEGAGDLTFSDLSLIYEYNSITQGSSTLYDMDVPQEDIIAIEDQVLEEGASIELDLELFTLKKNTIGDYTLEITFLNGTTTTALSIKEASEILDATTLIQTATEKFSDFTEETTEEYQVLSMLDEIQKIKQTQADLGEYKNQIGFTDESLLVGEIEATLANLPWEIHTAQTKSETQSLKISDIDESFGDQEEILAMQDAITVKTTLKTITLTNYNGEEFSYILIKKDFTAKEDLEAVALFEYSPISFDELLYTESPDSSLEGKAGYILDLKEGETKEFYYLTTEAVSLSDFQSIIVFTEEEEITSCGDFVCDRTEDSDTCPEDCTEEEGLSPLYIILPGVLIIVLASLFFFRKRFFKAKETTSNDPLVNFFKKGLAKGIKKEQLIDTLRKKGWKEADIQAAIKKL